MLAADLGAPAQIRVVAAADVWVAAATWLRWWRGGRRSGCSFRGGGALGVHGRGAGCVFDGVSQLLQGGSRLLLRVSAWMWVVTAWIVSRRQLVLRHWSS